MGTRAVTYTWTTSTRSLEEVRYFGSVTLVDALRRAGYRVTSWSDDEIVMVRPSRSNPFLLLFSLLAYLLSMDRPCQVVVIFSQTAQSKSRMKVIGDIPTKLAAELTELPQS